MKNTHSNKLLFLMLFIGFQNIAFAQCDNGDQRGVCGCPDPSGNCGGQGGIGFTIPIIVSGDPNEIIGPQGFGEKKWVSSEAIMPYKILFENDPDFATAPAQKVIVYLPIPAHLNPNSLRLSDFGFGSFNFSVPFNSTTYYQRLNVKDSLGVYVDITAGLDQANNRAFWIFESIDTLTGLASTVAPGTGFLPINDSLIHNGEGYVSLTLKPSASALSFDSVFAKAAIVFDSNDTILTNTAVNIIDATKPQSQIDTLASLSGNLITLSWSGTDSESGLRSYTIYYSANNGPFIPLVTDTTITTIQFIGQSNIDYRFYSIAIDSAGNREDPPLIADALTHVDDHTLLLNLKVFIQGFYLYFETMQPVLFNQGVTSDVAIVDTILVELRQNVFPFNVVASQKAMLLIDGHSLILFDSINYGSYYLVIKNRSTIQTWSALPINFTSPQLSYDFTTSPSQAYGDNMIAVEPGIFAIYSGDLNQDENVDLFDMNIFESSVSNFEYGYLAQDLNGDGNVDLLDGPILEENVNSFIFSMHP